MYRAIDPPQLCGVRICRDLNLPCLMKLIKSKIRNFNLNYLIKLKHFNRAVRFYSLELFNVTL